MYNAALDPALTTDRRLGSFLDAFIRHRQELISMICWVREGNFVAGCLERREEGLVTGENAIPCVAFGLPSAYRSGFGLS